MSEQIDQRLKVLRIIVLAMTGGIVVFSVVALCVVNLTSHVPDASKANVST